MRRREFLGVAGAGVLGALWRPKEGADVAVNTPWTELDYGTDLSWTSGTPLTPTQTAVTLGGSTAIFRYRRVNEQLMFQVKVTIGSGVSFANTGPWRFQIPAGLVKGSPPGCHIVWGSFYVAATSGTYTINSGVFLGGLGTAQGAGTFPDFLQPYANQSGLSGFVSSIYPQAPAVGDIYYLGNALEDLSN